MTGVVRSIGRVGQTDSEDGERRRWIALYVLCVGMLMIILDSTIVNVALPSIQDGPRLLAVEPRLGRERLPDPVRRPAAARRAARRPDRPPAHVHGRPRRLHRRLAGLRARPEPGDADRGAVRPGRRRRADLRGDPGDDRDDVPGAARAGEGDRRLQLRRFGRRVDRAARGRRAHGVDQLALDLLRQPADRRRRPRYSRRGCSTATRGSASGTARTCSAPRSSPAR